MKRPRESRELAHDFNNLLTAIISAADAVLERSVTDPETRADVAHIREGARRGTALLRRSGVPPVRDVISVNETIRATSRLLAHRLGAAIDLTMDLAEPGGMVWAEPAQLDRALLNLIANARHAMPTGGTVTLRTECRTFGAPDVRIPDTIAAGDYVVLTVADTGAGIPRDQLPRIFEPGVSSRRRAGGSGLGLSSVRDIVRECDGFVTVESVEGQGTRFEIYLPRKTNGAQPATSAHSVLLVDDDPLVRQVTERILHRAGWHVRCAGSAEAALAIMEKSPCDLMISDLAMPGMDGLALTRLVLARWPELPVILTSGYEQTEDGFSFENVVFLAKPFGQADLLEAVARVAPQSASATRSAQTTTATTSR